MIGEVKHKHNCDYCAWQCDCAVYQSKIRAILHNLEYPEQVNTFGVQGDFVMISLYKKYIKELIEASNA